MTTESNSKSFCIPDFLLPDVVVQFDRNTDSVTPFPNDEEYFYAILACETALYYSHKIRYEASRHFMSPSDCSDRDSIPDFPSSTMNHDLVSDGDLKDNSYDSKVIYWKNMYEYYRSLFERMSDKRKKKILLSFDAATNKSSLVVEQFLINMECEEEWQKEVFYVFLCSCSNQLVGFPGDQYYENRIDQLYWLRHLFPRQYNTGAVARLFDMDSKFVKEHMYQHATNQSESKILLCKMTEGVVSIFMGCLSSISVTQYQELESTILQETLLECEGFQRTTAGKAILETKLFNEKCKNRSHEADGDGDDDNGRTNTPLLIAMQKMEGKNTTDRIYNLIAEVARQENDNDFQNETEEQDEEPGDEEDEEDGVFDNEAEDDSGEFIEKDDLLDNEEDNSKIKEAKKKRGGKKNLQTMDSADSASMATYSDAMSEFGPYKNNLQYLEDQISLFNKIVLLNKEKNKLANDFDNANGEYYDENYNRLTKEQYERMVKSRIDKNDKKVMKLRERIQIKLAATKIAPRLEQLVTALQLEEFEKLVLLNLIKCILMPNSGYNQNGGGDVVVGQTIGDAIQNFATSLEDKMLSRKYFYKTSTLIKEGILCISQNDFMEDLTNCSIDLDRRMFDFLVGLDTEFSEVVDGSHLYIPNVSFDDTVLPANVKNKILERIEKFDEIKNTYNELSIDEKITYGTGQVLLFYGASGTGKTMMANAIATKLKKKILLINFPSLGTNSSGRIIKFLFREARIQKALLFFDECESLFRSRDVSCGDASVNMVLTELERFNGLCILATNRPMDIDEAMHRRITLAVEFHKPDRFAREQIWKNLHPPKLQLDDNVNICELARKFELTGGHIKNAWLSAIGQMVQRGGKKVTQEDLIISCSDQIVGRLSLEEFDQRIVPTCGLDSMIVSDSVKESLESIVNYTQAQTVLFGSWGFGSVHRAKTGATALFYGPPGTGKTMAAEAISFDLGKPLMVVNLSELVSKWVGETGQNIAAVFDSAKSKDVVLVFDEAEGLFGERSSSSDGVGRHDNMNVGLLLKYMESFPGVCIVITNKENLIDDAFYRRFNYVIQFERPNVAMRQKIWKTMIPKECPLRTDVDIAYLAQRYKFCGGDIKNALFYAATKAALRNNASERMIAQNDLEKACDDEEKKMGLTHQGYRVNEVSSNNFDLAPSRGNSENLYAAE